MRRFKKKAVARIFRHALLRLCPNTHAPSQVVRTPRLSKGRDRRKKFRRGRRDKRPGMQLTPRHVSLGRQLLRKLRGVQRITVRVLRHRVVHHK